MTLTFPTVMGILNLTPDSFSDGGRFMKLEEAAKQIDHMIKNGAGIIDVGGESTGPGSSNISAEDELARVKPVIDHISEKKLYEKVMFSIDTYKAPVAEYALAHSFAMINDVTAFRGDKEMIKVIAKHHPYVVIMHSKDPTARTTKDSVEYNDVMDTIKKFLHVRIKTLKKIGLPASKIILDPGMGMFVSANPEYSYEIIDRLDELTLFNHPILIGPSRKSFLGGNIENRDDRSWELAQKAIANGAGIVRMHHIRPLP
jgi:dihydropteroate synthase